VDSNFKTSWPCMEVRQRGSSLLSLLSIYLIDVKVYDSH
jgi:hypothetical protein